MTARKKLTREDIEKSRKILYHHVDCGHLVGLKISLSAEAQRNRAHLAILGISSQETIRKGLQAVDASPFKTVFVVREETGAVLYALSKNEEYVAAAKKKKKTPNPPAPAPAPAPSYCCQICAFHGGYSCQALADGSCICFGATHETGGGGLDDSLETLAR